jgi:HEAT repeat protein
MLAFLAACQPAFAQDPSVLADQLKSGNGEAASALARQGAKAVPALIGILKDGDPRARSQAAWALGEIGPAAKEAVPELARALDQPADGVGVASQAAQALGKIGPAAAPELVQVLEKGKQAPAVHAARALKAIPQLAKGAAPALLAALRKDAPIEQRIAFIDALGNQGAEATAAVPVLIELAQKERATRVPVIVALGNMGSAAKEAVPFLVELMKKKEPGPVPLHAAQAVGKIGIRDPAIAEALLELMKDGQQPRMALLESLSKAGKVTKESLPAIAQAMRDKDPMVRLYTAQLVGSVDPNDLSVVSVLVESLQDKNAAVRKLAAEVLQSVQPRDESVVEALRQAANDQDAAVRKAAAQALEKFKKK